MFPQTLETISTCAGCGSHTRSVSLVTNTTMLVNSPIGPVLLYIDATQLLSITGQPAGTSFGTDLGAAPGNLGIWYNTGTVPNQVAAVGCSYVTGDEATWNAAVGGGPNNDGIYPLTITVDARINSTSPDVSSFVPNGSWATTVPANLGGGAIVFDTYQLVVTPDGLVGIEGRTSNFGAYPNPASDAVRFQLGKHNRASVDLFDLRGTLVAHATLAAGNATLLLDAVANGLYIYKLYDAQGQLMHTDRVAVAH